jgi:hypothetical protein
MVVDFPDPFGPMNPTTSPLPIEKDIASTAFTEPYDFVRDSQQLT